MIRIKNTLTLGKISVETIIRRAFNTFVIWGCLNLIFELIKNLIDFSLVYKSNLFFTISIEIIKFFQEFAILVLTVIMFKYICEIIYKILKASENIIENKK
ncbi:hypothetical protein [Clostridium sp. Ade.TY]|uniref:hypothetical protein n=1 Tax=Clostridium sp. Ade.TY TaxID=1391647 RepID=UPI0003FCAC94|nr:hypothetical protein [Clostridium sp. Ade.TY]